MHQEAQYMGPIRRNEHGKGNMGKGTKWTPQVQKARTVLRFGAPMGGEVPKQSEWDATPLASQGAQKASPLPRFRAPRGGEVSKQSEWARAPPASPGDSESVAPATLPSTQGKRGLEPI